MSHYPDVQPNPDFSGLEESVLAFWREQQLFRASVDNRPLEKDGKHNEFIFYDGPPFANGLPHYGHLLTGFVKDLFARYQTMRGKRVERRFGWDCHGLPAEMGAEKELGISGRQAISKFGIDKFNEYCRSSVMKFRDEWEHYVTRQARWVDFAGDYKTMDTTFMESVLWAFSQLHEKGLIYEAYRVMPYSWAAETPLSNFETRLDNSYREREDKAITVAFELNTRPPGAPEAEKYYILAWTTTPWTLPSNLALAVNRDIGYEYFSDTEGNIYIASAFWIRNHKAQKEYAEKYTFEIEGQGTQPIDGNTLIGLSYHPLFPYFAEHPHSFRILDGSDFVSDTDGTGVVHMAPGFGEDDQRVCEQNGITIVCPVDHAGRYTNEIFDIPVPSLRGAEGDAAIQTGSPRGSAARDDEEILSLKGMNVIAEPGGSKFGLANDKIVEYLKKTGRLIKQETIVHNYPHCWRTDQPLIYRAISSWYVEVTKFRERMVELNRQINWIPDYVGPGLFGKWLENARDWSISRNRFWGTPIPVWRSDNPNNKKLYVFGSIRELEDFFGVPVKDLHRPYIDELTKPDPENPEYTLRRVEDVFDCWFESGSMPYGQVHYPFENREWFETHAPADFIVEYVAQTRGWFYTLMVLSTALFDKPPFLNCICHGVVLGEPMKDPSTGKMVTQKLSKRLKNYPDPIDIFNQYGADAVRWFMMSSPVMRGSEMIIDKEGLFIRDAVRLYVKPIWNAYNFFCLYANADKVEAKFSTVSENVMDRYILAKCRIAVAAVEKALDAYDTPGATDAVSAFFEVLNNWYIRRSKERFWKEEKDTDKLAAYDTLYTVLHIMCRAVSPLLPCISEVIYQGLQGNASFVKKDSVHLADFPSSSSLRGAEGDAAIQPVSPRGSAARDDDLMAQMDFVQAVCNTGLAIRNKNNIRVRQPLKSYELVASKEKIDLINSWEQNYLKDWSVLVEIISDEIHVKMRTLRLGNVFDYATLKLTLNNPVLGKRVPEKMKQIIPAAKKGEWKQLPGGGVEVCGEILQPEEYTLQLEPKPEYKDRAQALSTNDALVILDTTVTPELEAEGIARDVVRMIQQARKDAGLNVSDRIALSIKAEGTIASAVKAHETYIREQTLAASLSDSAPANAFTAENSIDEQPVVIALSRVA